MTRTVRAIFATAAAAALVSCAGVPAPRSTPSEAVPAGASLWSEPQDFAAQDLFNGPWGTESAPDPAATYTLVERKHTGVNLGLTVTDPQGREWSVKQAYPGGLDPEGPVEVVLSRLLSGIGYHQPPVYFVPAFRLKDDFGTRTEIGGRFRLKQETLVDKGAWKWEDNPFVGSKPYQGLIVLLTMFNSTDLKDSNNSLYEKRGDQVEQWYVARDIGAALGDVNGWSPRKSHIDSFERTPYIVGVNNGWVQFAYNGWYKNLVRDRITPGDVKWASDLLGRLSETQLNDAFRAAGYAPDIAHRYVVRLQEKIAQGQALEQRASAGQ